MNLKFTLGTLIVLIGLGTYVAVYEREPKDPTAQASKGPDEVQLLKFEMADLAGLTVSTSDATMEATRASAAGSDATASGDWAMAGTGTKLDAEQVDSPLRSLQDLKSRRLVSTEATDQERTSFGLDQPHTTISFKWREAKDKPEALVLGNNNLDQSGYYAQTKPGKGIYVIDRYSVDRLTDMAKNPPLASPSPAPQP